MSFCYILDYLLLDYFHSLWLGSTIFDFLSWLGFRSLLPCQPRRRIACPLAVTTNSIIGNWNSFGPGPLRSLETRFFDWWIVSEWALVFPGPWYRNLPLSSTLVNGTNPHLDLCSFKIYSLLSSVLCISSRLDYLDAGWVCLASPYIH